MYFFPAAKFGYFDFCFSIFKINIKKLVESFLFLTKAILMENCYPAEWSDKIPVEVIGVLLCRMAVFHFLLYLENMALPSF